MPDATELVSAAELKRYLMITSSSYDTILQEIKDGVEDWVKQYLDRDLLVSSYTEYYDGDGSGSLRVRNYPITAITSIYADPARLFAAGSLIPSSDVISGVTQNDNVGLIELYSYKFLKGVKGIKITYSAGYATIPERLQHAVKLICAREFLIQDKRMSGMVTQQVGDKTIALELDAIPKNALSILERFRRIEIL